MNQVQQDLQTRLDELLAGHPRVTLPAIHQPQNQGVFASYDPSDMKMARNLALSWMKATENKADLDGLTAAIDMMYEQVGQYPLGIVEYAAKLFMAHSPLAGKYLRFRSLEERQPGMVLPSGP